MTLLDRIKALASSHQMSLAELERKLDFSNGSMRKWANSTPSLDKVEKVANYFNVSLDYLKGRTDNPKIASDDEVNEVDLKEAAKESFFYDGHELNDEDIELISSILETRIKNRK
ncbi:helix-turn-helix domain-containing protein [Streptococcus gallolyticus]|uniref:helix-turn-helix domain-containing protein n=1 Tax=Streptococcus gallolyticus TaxID=315405 RepID=UPI000E40E4AE|nr:helix-turn-helix transcriptional regulator [Streptococcus gallolyticus]RGC38168.1 XRE family transcriptional regulator [Streptococcus gallolyticus]